MILKPPADADARRKEKHNAYMRDWRAKNPDKVKPASKEKQREYQRDYRARNKDNPEYRARVVAQEHKRPKRQRSSSDHRKYHLKHKFNLTPEQFDAMMLAQDGRCAICSTADPGGAHGVFHIDHCHTTGKVRELLCHSCNTSLGHFNDDAAALRRAAEYLDKHADG